MNNPGDYYKQKRKDAEEAKAALTHHQKDCAGKCKTCKRLEYRLELARYVGD